MINSIKKLFYQILNHISGKYSYQYFDEIPEKLKAKKLYIAQDNDTNWLSAMLCPCGCGSRIYLNLLSEAKPSWKILIDLQENPSVFPSVWRMVGCKSHFFLRKGRIVWAHSATSNTTYNNRKATQL